MARRLLEIAASIVKARASVASISPEEIEETLMKTFQVLQRMQDAEQQGFLLGPSGEIASGLQESSPPKISDPMDSIRENRISCLECGVEMKQLTKKHLGSHGLTPREYKKKWGLPIRQSLSAKALSKARSKAARKRGLPENLIKFQEERRLRAAAANPPVPPEA